ncbi:hypothetical protein ACWDA7_34795 [Streptomyces sp. NPDC001156]
MLTPPEITRTTCGGCGALVEGLNERYSCTVCGWVNQWDDSTSPLPAAEDDPDYPGPRRRR